MDSVEDTAEAVGCPIRKSTDQCLLAAPRGLSQRATSFIASQCQGIHQMPFRRLISLMRHAQEQARTRHHSAREIDQRRPSPVTQGPSAARLGIGGGGELRHCPYPSPPLGAVRAERPAGRSSVTNRFHDVLDPAPSRTEPTHRAAARWGWRSLPADTLEWRRSCRPSRPLAPDGGGGRDRTDDLMLAKHALSQLSYAPFRWKAGGPGRI